MSVLQVGPSRHGTAVGHGPAKGVRASTYTEPSAGRGA